MKASQLIKKLQNYQKKYGDIEVGIPYYGSFHDLKISVVNTVASGDDTVTGGEEKSKAIMINKKLY